MNINMRWRKDQDKRDKKGSISRKDTIRANQTPEERETEQAKDTKAHKKKYSENLIIGNKPCYEEP